MNRSNYLKRCLLITGALCFMLVCSQKAAAQKYAFAHYDIEDGLIQSQVNNMSQDNTHRLWISTLGGICRFDGRDYYSLSKANGLPNNFVYITFADSKGTLWVGTNKGLSSLKDQKIYNYPIPNDVKRTFVVHIAEDGGGAVYAVMSSQLYKVANRQLRRVKVPDSLNYSITSITTDKAGYLYVSIIGKGVYRLNNNKWELFAAYQGMMKNAFVFKMQFDKRNKQRLYLLTLKKLFIATANSIVPYQNAEIDAQAGPLLSFDQDYNNNYWLGTQRGAYFVKGNQTIHFTASNGLTNNSVSDIFCDNDRNVWLGTQGSGFYRYEGAEHVVYDQSQGINVNQVVMSIGRDSKNNILLGTAGNGIMQYSNGKLNQLWQPPLMAGTASIQTLFTDKDKNVWVGTDRIGIWKYNGSTFNFLKGSDTRSINYITADKAGTVWIATPQGCYYYENNTMNLLPGNMSFTSAILPLGKDSLLLGTQEGAKLFVNKTLVAKFKLGAVTSSSILCMAEYDGKVFFGTDDRGMFVWDRHYGILKNYTIANGFRANSIYSIVADNRGVIWVGTGRGINRITVIPGTMDCKIQQAGTSRDLLVESNQNAALYDNQQVFFGTTKGIIVFNANIMPMPEGAPHVLIQNVKLFTDGSNAPFQINDGFNGTLKLKASQNHIVISFQGVYLKKPEDVTYQYRLTGLDDQFCWPVKTNYVDYPSLPPGHYTFEVKALSPEGKVSSGVARLKFEVAPHFYQQPLFRILVVVLLVLLGIGLQRFIHRRQINEKLALEQLKRDEKQKLRQQTAEDFHDDLGNKLTRITVLTDVLNTKLGDEKSDQKNLVEQIQQNAAALYNGTKDILWALDPKSDNLYETLMHIKETGIEMFQDVNIDFSFDGITENYNEVKLPMEYSRNITMIFKELLTNVLKHADARNVALSLEQPDKNHLVIKIVDDGKGYDEQKGKRGHGIVNIKSRAGRIGAKFSIGGNREKGTVAELRVKLDTKL